jgi:hypothetical protein
LFPSWAILVRLKAVKKITAGIDRFPNCRYVSESENGKQKYVLRLIRRVEIGIDSW